MSTPISNLALAPKNGVSAIELSPDRFGGWLQSKKVHDRLNQALHGCDDGELFLESSHAEVFEFSDKSLKTANMSSSQGFGFRSVCGDLVGYAHANVFTDQALDSAIDAASLVKKGYSGTWTVSPAPGAAKCYDAIDPRVSISVIDRISLLRDVDEHLRSRDARVVQVNASISAMISITDILRKDGECFSDVKPLVQFRVSVIVSEKGRTETGMSAIGGRYDLSHLVDQDSWRATADEALRIAIVNLRSVPAPAGQMTVMLAAGWPGMMVHEAVGHGLEGDAIYRNQSVYAGQVGEQVAAKGVTIIDDGTLQNRRGSLSRDDEGTPTQCNVLIEDGILKGYMHDRLSARLLKVAPTGNGRRQNYQREVLPRMTNTYLANGPHSPEDILESIEDGIFAASLGGGQVNPVTGDFVFKCVEAYRIRNGVIEEPVTGATIVGNGPVAMKNVAMVGNDTELDAGMGVCGKQGQTVPVGVGQPTVRIDNLTVGGTGH